MGSLLLCSNVYMCMSVCVCVCACPCTRMCVCVWKAVWVCRPSACMSCCPTSIHTQAYILSAHAPRLRTRPIKRIQTQPVVWSSRNSRVSIEGSGWGCLSQNSILPWSLPLRLTVLTIWFWLPEETLQIYFKANSKATSLDAFQQRNNFI